MQPINPYNLPPGYQLVPQYVYEQAPNGAIFQRIIGMRPVWVGLPVTAVYPFATDQSERVAMVCTSDDEPDETPFGYAEVPNFNPMDRVQATEELKAMLGIAQPQPEPTHESALMSYRKTYQQKSPYPESYRNNKKDYYRDPALFNPARFGPVKSYIDQTIIDQWLCAALHFLPLDIVGRLDEIDHSKKRDKFGNFVFLIPCFASCTHPHFQRIAKLRELQNACIEFVLTEQGEPVHFFMRPLAGRSEEHLVKHLGDCKEAHDEVQTELHFPRLQDTQTKKQVTFKFNSEYHFEITVIKKGV